MDRLATKHLKVSSVSHLTRSRFTIIHKITMKQTPTIDPIKTLPLNSTLTPYGSAHSYGGPIPTYSRPIPHMI